MVYLLPQINPCLEEMLGIEPLELHFPFEHNKAMTHSIELINDTDDCFAFRITTSSSLLYCTQPSKSVVPPRSKCSVTITLQALEMAPEQCNYGASQFNVESTRVDESLVAEDITEDMFDEKPGKVVDKVNLIVVLE
jgi:coatomer subunit beta'